MILGNIITLFCRLFKPISGLFVVYGNTQSLSIHKAITVLCRSIPSFRSLFQPIRSLLVVLGDSITYQI